MIALTNTTKEGAEKLKPSDFVPEWKAVSEASEEDAQEDLKAKALGMFQALGGKPPSGR